MFEVVGPRIGELHVQDVRDAISSGSLHVTVMVLAADGGLPFVGRVDLGEKRSGRSSHRVFLCPECRRPRRVLYIAGPSRLLCADCSDHRTRRQRERTFASWRRGGREEDELFRLLLRPGRCEAALRRAHRLVDELLAGDHDRLMALRRVSDAITEVDVETAQKNIPD